MPTIINGKVCYSTREFGKAVNRTLSTLKTNKLLPKPFLITGKTHYYTGEQILAFIKKYGVKKRKND